MKLILFTFLVFASFNLEGQSYIDIAAQQNVNVYAQSFDGWAIGMSLYDFNQDGWDDLTYVMQNNEVKFFLNDNGNFVEIQSYVYSIGSMKHLLWVDYDNDDDLDIFTTYHDRGIRMYQNNGQFQFQDVTSLVGFTTEDMFSYGASFADYDKDGFLDVYIANYESLTYNPGIVHENLLYHNNGDGTFSNVTSLAGVGNGFQTSFCGVWIDLNNDSWLDLHVINDRFTTLNALYINNGDGTFTDQAAAWNLTMPLANPMSNSFSDFDNDNDYDLFVTNTSGATVQDDSYNFMVNNGNNQYTDLLNQYGIDSTHWAWGALWVDYNNDMYEDLLIATGELSPVPVPEFESWFYKNNQGQSFSYWNDSILFNTKAKSFCPVKGDFNNDGFYDIAMQNDSPKNTFLMQNSGNSNNYLKIELETSVSNKQAIGAEVEVFIGGTKQMQTVLCGEGLCGQSSQYLIFGANQATIVDSVVVTFPSGIVKVEQNIPVNQKITIYESTTFLIDVFPSDTLSICSYDTLVLGETGYFSYSWNNGSATDLLSISEEGSYSFVALDSLGNSYLSDSVVVQIDSMVNFIAGPIQDYCGLGIGTIELFPLTSSVLPYTINWSNGDVGLVSDSLNAGWYSYIYSDSLNCYYDADSILIENSSGHLTSIQVSPQMDNQFGFLNATTFGGVEPYDYYLNDEQIQLPQTDLVAGNYSLIVIDAAGCMDSLAFEILDQVIGLGIGEEYSPSFNAWYQDGYLKLYLGKSVTEFVQLFDNLGRSIELKNGNNIDGIQVYHVILEPGVYHLIIQVNGELNQLVFVVQ